MNVSTPLACTVALGLLPTVASAQTKARTTAQETQVTENGRDYRFTVYGGGAYQFESDIDSGGDFSVARLGAGAALNTNFNADFSVGFQLSYGVDMYDFKGTSLGVAQPASPWDDVHTLTAGAIFNLKLNTDWSVFGGPIFQSARESGGDFSDSLTGGGLVGLTYQASRDLVIGGGVGIMSQLEDDTRIFPIIIVDWEFANNFHLRNTSATNAPNRNGIELVYNTGRKWEFAIGGARQFSRFRLDDDAHAPDGVGEDHSIPIWFRTTFKCSEQCSIDGIIGFNAAGDMQLENSAGTNLASSDYDAALFVGVFGSFRF